MHGDAVIVVMDAIFGLHENLMLSEPDRKPYSMPFTVSSILIDKPEGRERLCQQRSRYRPTSPTQHHCHLFFWSKSGSRLIGQVDLMEVRLRSTCYQDKAIDVTLRGHRPVAWTGVPKYTYESRLAHWVDWRMLKSRMHCLYCVVEYCRIPYPWSMKISRIWADEVLFILIFAGSVWGRSLPL